MAHMTARLETAPGSNVVELASEDREATLWADYCLLVQQRERESRFTDLELNKRIGRAWDRWWQIARLRDGEDK
jgi:hypothetical protein